MSNTLAADPKWAIPNVLMLDPKRMTERKLIEDAQWKKSKTDNDEPKRIMP
jgi:hypothetical protein